MWGVDKFDTVASSPLDTDEVDMYMWKTFAFIQTAQYTCCAVASHVSNVVELTGVLHNYTLSFQQLGLVGNCTATGWLVYMVMSATLMVSGWSARCFENGEELPGDSDQLCGAHMEEKHGSTGHGGSNSPVRVPSGGSSQGVLAWHSNFRQSSPKGFLATSNIWVFSVSWPPAMYGCFR